MGATSFQFDIQQRRSGKLLFDLKMSDRRLARRIDTHNPLTRLDGVFKQRCINRVLTFWPATFGKGDIALINAVVTQGILQLEQYRALFSQYQTARSIPIETMDQFKVSVLGVFRAQRFNNPER